MVLPAVSNDKGLPVKKFVLYICNMFVCPGDLCVSHMIAIFWDDPVSSINLKPGMMVLFQHLGFLQWQILICETMAL